METPEVDYFDFLDPHRADVRQHGRDRLGGPDPGCGFGPGQGKVALEQLPPEADVLKAGVNKRGAYIGGDRLRDISEH